MFYLLNYTYRFINLSLLGVILSTMTLSQAKAQELNWQSQPPLPDNEGFAGSFSGTSNGVLLVAGGSNFPEKRPWQGGTKVWYDKVYALKKSDSNWTIAGKLPCANGYGISITVDSGMIIIGGGDSKHNFSDVWLIKYTNNRLSFIQWPKLPQTLAQATGALNDRTIYVFGGINTPNATHSENNLYALNIDNISAGWRVLESCPGPGRILATSAACKNTFYIFGGARLLKDNDGKAKREWLVDAWSYKPNQGWFKLANLPRACVAAPTPAAFINNHILIMGGDDGSQVNLDPTKHKGFPRDILAYEPNTDKWSILGNVPFSLVTTPLTYWDGKIIITGGEQRPGVRSPAVWSASY